MRKPILVVMAAGLGSRYGGLKQMEPIGDKGEWLIDFSLYDAHRAGFEKVVFIVREEILQDFKETIGQRIAPKLQVCYAVQKVTDLPEGYTLPAERTKPWGTAHAIYSGRKEINGHPFMAINADDYYGPKAFQEIYDFLDTTSETDENYKYAMVGYKLDNTVTEHGSVSRGICEVDDSGMLRQITERTHIEKHSTGIKYTEDAGHTWMTLPDVTSVSLNCWGFHPSIIKEMEQGFPRFLDKALIDNPEKAEYFLPSVVESLIEQKKTCVTVLSSPDKWYGITYQEDRKQVMVALAEMKEQDLYPADLWN